MVMVDYVRARVGASIVYCLIDKRKKRKERKRRVNFSFSSNFQVLS
uniref:Uncharacterized protein n=1 Tax=Rhizophora mucronata TaxID=61149 RepID=A0A2P2QT85_RHIMU